MASKSYRICAVPLCQNTTIKTPSKLFIHVPQSQNIRVKWLQLARRDPTSVSPKSSVYFCEDHFDLPKDMENYMAYNIMGSVSAIRMKPSCLPSRFKCQPDRIKRTAKSMPRPVAVKRQRKLLIQEMLKQTETKTVDTPSTSNIESQHTNIGTGEMNYLNKSMTSSSRVCRGCLAGDIRLYDIRQNNLMEAYYTLLNTAVSTQVQVTDERPHYLCSYCAALLLKCDSFRTKCIDSLKVLKDAEHNLDFTTEQVNIINQSAYLQQSVMENINVVDQNPERKRKYSDISSDTDTCSKSDLSDISFDSDISSDTDTCSKSDLSDISFDSDDSSGKKIDCTVSDNDRRPTLKAKSIIKINTEHDNPPNSSNNVIKSQLRTYFDDKSSGLLKDFQVNINFEEIKGMRNKRMNQLLEIIEHIEYSSGVSTDLLKILDEDVPKCEKKASKSVTGTDMQCKVVNQESKSDGKAKTISVPEVGQTSKEHVQKDLVQDNTNKSVLESQSNIIPVIDNIEVDDMMLEASQDEPFVFETQYDEIDASLDSEDDALSAIAETAKPDSKSSKCKKKRAKRGEPNYRGCKNTISDILKRRQTNKIKFSKDFLAKYNSEVRYLTKQEQIMEISNRKESANYKNGTFKCNICFKGFVMDETYKNHMLLHDDISGKFICDICQCHYMTKQKLDEHLKNHTLKYTCKECGFTTKHDTIAVRHYRWHNGKKYSCKDCGKEFERATTRYAHIKQCHSNSEQLVRCEICGDLFNGLLGLNWHEVRIHKEMYSPECRCSGCNTQFYCSDAFKAHQGADGLCITTHKYCVRCGMSFETEQLLKEHEIEQRKSRDGFECEVCNKKFEFFSKLKTHQTQHMANCPKYKRIKNATNGGKNIICEVCGKSMQTVSLLKIHHRAVHSDERPFKCTVCPKGCKTPALLVAHMRVHTGERPFQCQICPKAFQNVANLNRHKLIHTGERPYSCDICGKSFQSSTSVKTHVKTVHMKIPMPPRIRRRNKKNEIK